MAIQYVGFKELEKAIKRNPRTVLDQTRSFLQRSMALYRSGIQNNPWRVGESGGGAPVDTRNLLQSHAVVYENFKASIGPSRNNQVSYAPFVHEGTKRMTARPWLDYAQQNNEQGVQRLYQELLKNIVIDLAR